MTIKKEEKRKQLFSGPSNRVIEEQCLEIEQEEILNQTPEEKTFRNYKCIFTWKYLLQYGFSNFFGTENWKNERPYNTFKRFDKLIWEKEPKPMKRFTETLEKYFKDNPEEIWCDKNVMAQFLPKGNINLKSLVLKEINPI